jgi:salicylate hydroxylase
LARFARCRTIHRGPVFVTPPLAEWAFGRVALLGDAAHAMMPFEAQGAAQAIEDSYVLGECLAGVEGVDVVAALRRYEALRAERATAVQQASERAAEVFYLPDGPAQRERDADYQTVHQRQPGGRRRWIWEYDVRKVAAV